MGFFEEFEALRLKTPRLFNINIGSQNSDYCTHSDKNKNCYLLFAANFNEDCLYGGIVLSSRDCVDITYCDKNELCYECVDLEGSYNCNFSQDIKNCTDVIFCYDCIGCQNCFGCAGLRQKQYYFLNQPLSKEEYQKRLKELDYRSPAGRKRASTLLEEVKLKVPHRSMRGANNQNCFGDYINNSKNCFMGFNVYECEDVYYAQDIFRAKDSMDIMFAEGAELCYECFSFGLGTYNCNFCSYIRICSDCEYCELCFSCKNCFGCVGLQNKQYYILNQPYSREDYFKKIAEIKEKLKREDLYGRHHLPTTYKFEDTAAA